MLSSHRSRLLLALCLLSAAAPTSSDDANYAKSLLKFKHSLTNTSALQNWAEPVPNRLCSWNTPVWTGCICSNGSFVGLRLEGMGLSGRIDTDALSELPLFSFSVARNGFSGPLPEMGKLVKLRSLYLGGNGFGGEIDGGAFSGMEKVWKVVLSGNRFTGRIPASLVGLPRLEVLRLENNMFVGGVPEFRQPNLVVNFSNNRLRGFIPVALSKQNASSFYGNIDLCGKPLDPCKPKTAAPPLKMAFIAAAVAAITLSAFLTLIILHRRRPRPLKYSKSIDGFPMEDLYKKKPSIHMNKKKKKKEDRKLHFVRNNGEKFELEELLRASAQVLGSGSFGSSYKAAVLGSDSYVVRRFRKMSSVGREEFYEHMKILGRVSHPNVLPLVAFHYRREEKLLITKFQENGSLATHLHAKRSPDECGLAWATRLRIIKGVARGLAYLHKELPTLTLPHGHLKSSNVLLDNNFNPLLADYALAPVIDKDHAEQFMAAYKCPESTQNHGVTTKADVWSLGILILELLTGQFPASYLKQGKGPSSDLATWVSSVGREEWTAEFFDKDMSSGSRGGDQMLRLLRIGMFCCEWDVERRWDLREAVEKIEELESGE